MKRFRDALEKVLDQTKAAAQQNIPGGNVRDQLPGAALPPTGNLGSGYTPGDDSVTTAKILDGAVTIPKLSFDPATQTELDAEATTRAAADTALAAPQYLTLALSSTLVNERRLVAGTGISIADGGANGDATISNTGMTNPMTTAGDIIVGGSSGTPSRLAKGSDSQVLTVDPTTYLLVWATPASSGAPSTATYITQTHDATLSAEQALADLATGILKSTTSTGALSIATGADLPQMVASGASHSAGAVPDPGGSAGVVKFLREDASWQTPSGTGAPTDALYLTTAASASLSAEVVIPGLAGSPDISGAGGGGITEEYDTGSSGLTWGTAPATENNNSTVLLHLYVQWTAAVAEDLGTRAWAPSGAFDARVKIAMGNEHETSPFVTGFHIGNSGNTSRLLINVAATSVIAYTYASGSYTARGTPQSPTVSGVVYVRITRDGSNTITFYFSLNGIVWQILATQSFTFTVANIGYRVNTPVANAATLISDWLRTNV